MAMSVGADLWHMNNYAGPSMALKVPEVRTSFSMQALHYSKETPGGMIVVGPDARRFTDEKYKTRHGKIPVNGRWLPLSTPCPMYLICDHTLFSAGPLYDKHPSHGWTQIIERYDWSEDNSVELAKGWIGSADSLAALASVIGLDADTLVDSVDRWNRHCAAKHDADFGRKLMLAPIAAGPFYAVELSPSMLNTQVGRRRHERADRGLGGSGANGGVGSSGCDLRGHERRRNDGPGSGPGEVLRGAWAEDGDGGGPDPLSAAERAVHSSRGRVADADRARRVSCDRV
jgi:hypothetical protein